MVGQKKREEGEGRGVERQPPGVSAETTRFPRNSARFQSMLNHGGCFQAANLE